MKKLFFIFATVILLVNSTFAQTKTQTQIQDLKKDSVRMEMAMACHDILSLFMDDYPASSFRNRGYSSRSNSTSEVTTMIYSGIFDNFLLESDGKYRVSLNDFPRASIVVTPEQMSLLLLRKVRYDSLILKQSQSWLSVNDPIQDSVDLSVTPFSYYQSVPLHPKLTDYNEVLEDLQKKSK